MNAQLARTLETAASRFTDVTIVTTAVPSKTDPTQAAGFAGVLTEPGPTTSIVYTEREWAVAMLRLAHRIITTHEERWGHTDHNEILRYYSWRPLLQLQNK